MAWRTWREIINGGWRQQKLKEKEDMSSAKAKAEIKAWRWLAKAVAAICGGAKWWRQADMKLKRRSEINQK
jgi:hypothetical protein